MDYIDEIHVTKRKGNYIIHCVNPQCLEYIVEAFISTERFASNIIFSSKSLQTPKFYCFISMDHKGLVSLLISSLGVNKLLHGSNSSYPATETPKKLIQLLHMIPLKDWTQIQGKIDQCNLLYSPTSPYSQKPQSSHNTTKYSLFRIKHFAHSSSPLCRPLKKHMQDFQTSS